MRSLSVRPPVHSPREPSVPPQCNALSPAHNHHEKEKIDESMPIVSRVPFRTVSPHRLRNSQAENKTKTRTSSAARDAACSTATDKATRACIGLRPGLPNQLAASLPVCGGLSFLAASAASRFSSGPGDSTLSSASSSSCDGTLSIFSPVS